MTFLQVKNRAQTTLAAAASSTDTSISVTDVTPFPSTTPFHITIDDEILEVTAIDTDNNAFTVTRGAEGTTAADHDAGAAVELRVTAQIISDLQSRNLDSINDVSIATPADGDVLTYNDTTLAWENKAPSGFSSRVSACLSAAQSISASTSTVVAFDTKSFDGLGEFDTTTYQFTASSAGYYLVLGHINLGGSTTSEYYHCQIYKNGNSIRDFEINGTGGWLVMYFEAILSLAAGDAIDIRVYFGDAQDIEAGGGMSRLYIHRLS